MADVGGQINASLDDDELGEEDKGGGFGAKKILLFVVLPILLLGGIGAGLYFSGMIGGGEKAESHAADKGHSDKKGEHGKDGHAGTGAAFLEIPDMTVNLSSTDGQPRFLRLSVQLELSSEADKASVELVMPRVIDQFQTYLRELRVRDLRGSAGIYRLQMELLSRVNAAAYPVEVQDVLFQEILIQ